MVFSRILALIFLLYHNNVFAAVSVTSVEGASNFITTTPPRIFGGTAGLDCASSTFSTCDNCAGSPITHACNDRRIHPNLQLTIYVQSDAIDTGIVGLADANKQVQIPGGNVSGKVGAIAVPWSTICTHGLVTVDATTPADGNRSTCEFNGSATFQIGIDKSPTDGVLDESISVTFRIQKTVGSAYVDITNPTSVQAGCPPLLTTDPVCDFGVLPGDQKIFVVADQVEHGSSFPTGGANIGFTNLRLYYAPGPDDPDASGFGQITKELWADFGVVKSGEDTELTQDLLDGLENGVRYYFLAASVDEANNVGFFTDIAYLTSDPTRMLKYTAKPDEVFGLLSEDFQCFVATASYGSPMAKEVVTLRRFRNHLLSKYRNVSFPLVKFYYQHSTKLSRFIEKHPWAKATSRVVLWPSVWFAKITLKTNLPTAMGVFLAIFSGLMLLTVVLTRRVKCYIRS